MLLRQELADLIGSELRDPRLADIVSITRVDVSPDLRNANIYASVLGDEEAKAATMKALSAAATFLRRHLTERITIRRTPVLHFVLDQTIEEAARVLELMKRMPEPKQEP